MINIYCCILFLALFGNFVKAGEPISQCISALSVAKKLNVWDVFSQNNTIYKDSHHLVRDALTELKQSILRLEGASEENRTRVTELLFRIPTFQPSQAEAESLVRDIKNSLDSISECFKNGYSILLRKRVAESYRMWQMGSPSSEDIREAKLGFKRHKEEAVDHYDYLQEVLGKSKSVEELLSIKKPSEWVFEYESL